MSTISHGMDLAAVEELGRLLQAKSDQLRHLVTVVEGVLGRTLWQGPDATAFTQQWWPEHRARLQGAADRIHGFGQSALNNATEQRSASAVGGLAGAAVGRLVAPSPSTSEVGGPGDAGVRSVMPTRSREEIGRQYEQWASGRFAEGGESYYQCTAWANYRWQELGYSGTVSGNGGAMSQNAPGEISSSPSLHAMASYGSGTSSDYGHVMIVEEISADGRRIRVSEMNWDGGNKGLEGFRDTKWISAGHDGVFRSWRGQPISFAAFPG